MSRLFLVEPCPPRPKGWSAEWSARAFPRSAWERGYVLVVLLALGPVGSGHADEGGPILVELPSQVAIRSPAITVGAVARLSNGDPAVREQIAALDLAEFTTRDQAVSVRRRQVEFRLRLAGVAPDAFRVSGADEVVVTLARQAITADAVISAAREALLKRLPWPAEELSVELVHPVAARLPEAAAGEDVSFRAQPHSAAVGIGRVQMDVTIAVGRQPRLALPVLFDVRLLRRVALCLKPVAAGEVLTEGHVHFDLRPLAPNDRPAPENAVLGRKARPALRAGQVVEAGDVEEVAKPDDAVVIHARQRVNMVVRLGTVNVVATGEALQDGRLGQPIRAQNTDSKKVIVGRVSGPGTVEVESGGIP